METANAGRGVRGRYSTDDLVPDTVAGPYLFLEPEHAYVLDNGGRAVGYVIGTASTPDFVAAYQQRWLPRLRARYQPLSGPPVTEEEHRLDVMFHPERWLLPGSWYHLRCCGWRVVRNGSGLAGKCYGD